MPGMDEGAIPVEKDATVPHVIRSLPTTNARGANCWYFGTRGDSRMAPAIFVPMIVKTIHYDGKI